MIIFIIIYLFVLSVYGSPFEMVHELYDSIEFSEVEIRLIDITTGDKNIITIQKNNDYHHNNMIFNILECWQEKSKVYQPLQICNVRINHTTHLLSNISLIAPYVFNKKLITLVNIKPI
jgi:hypothetical protein